MRCWNSWNLVRIRSTGCASLPRHQGRQRKPCDRLFPQACTERTGTRCTSQPITPCQELSWLGDSREEEPPDREGVSWLGMLKRIVAYRLRRNVTGSLHAW